MAIPVIDNPSPAASSTVSTVQSVSFDVSDVEGLARVFVTATYGDGPITEAVHDGTGFQGTYSGSTNARTGASTGYTYTLLRDGGWPDGPFTISITAVDGAGNVVTEEFTWSARS